MLGDGLAQKDERVAARDLAELVAGSAAAAIRDGVAAELTPAAVAD
jgi:hypothetical protein